ncbi:Bax inhibitor-1/YccA family protein [Psychrobacter lutiphocae]|uniref:Bax inhibitor-1/YccA family protein n=1 Tax=Psychrobacter lutiphocae TaxID=540500 RepID=UPI000362AD81|nr:Bax inhibitor-1/YccA family protein [Psychrobacter lutiphocae]
MANPIVSRAEFTLGGKAMTVQGVVHKTSFLLGLSALAAIGFFFYIVSGGMSFGMAQMITFGSMFAAFGLGLFITFKPQKAKALAAPYAILEGIFLGGVSLMFAAIDPTIPVNALAATFVTAAVMLGLYRSGLIKVNEKFRSIMMSAIIAIMLIYLAQWGFVLFGSSLPFLFQSGGLVAIGFSLFVVVIASFSLLLDFDNVERGVAAGISEEYEWVFGVGILATLVWMYFEFMRLLSHFQD